MPRLFVFLLAALALAAAPGCNRAAPPPPSSATPAANTFTGTVAETMDAGGYTYARLQPASGEDVWIASTEFTAAPGEQLTVSLDMPVLNFESKTLQRTFPVVYFVAGVGRGGQPPANGQAPPSMMTSHGAPAAPQAPVQPTAPPKGGIAIAEVLARRASLAGTVITVRGTVVKVNEQIMGRNWIHLQDGSGSASDGTHDLTITTTALVNTGDVVTFTGVVAVDRDFGAGYVYPVILENATTVAGTVP